MLKQAWYEKRLKPKIPLNLLKELEFDDTELDKHVKPRPYQRSGRFGVYKWNHYILKQDYTRRTRVKPDNT